MKKTSLCILLCLILVLCGGLVACGSKTYFNITLPAEQVGYTVNITTNNELGDSANVCETIENEDLQFDVYVLEGYDCETLVVKVDGITQTNTPVQTGFDNFRYTIASVNSDHTIDISVQKKTLALSVDFLQFEHISDKAFLSLKSQFLNDVAVISIYAYDKTASNLRGQLLQTWNAQLLLQAGGHKQFQNEIDYGNNIIIDVVAKEGNRLFEHREAVVCYQYDFDYGNGPQSIMGHASVLRNNFGELILPSTNPYGAQLVVNITADGVLNFASLYEFILPETNVEIQATTALANIQRVGKYDYSGVGTGTSFDNLEWDLSDGDYCFIVTPHSSITNPEEQIESVTVRANGIKIERIPGEVRPEIDYLPAPGYTGDLGWDEYDYSLPVLMLLNSYPVKITVDVELKDTAPNNVKFEVVENGFTNELKDNLSYQYFNIYSGSSIRNTMKISPTVTFEKYGRSGESDIEKSGILITYTAVHYTNNIDFQALATVSRFDYFEDKYVAITTGYEIVLSGGTAQNPYHSIFIGLDDTAITNDIQIELNASAFERKTYDMTLPFATNADTYYLNSAKAWVKVDSANQVISVQSNQQTLVKIVPNSDSFVFSGFAYSGEDESYAQHPEFLINDTFGWNGQNSSSDGNFYAYIMPAYQNVAVSYYTQ